MAEQIAGAYLQSLANVPAWFATGGARAIAARIEPKNALVKQWDAQLQEAASAGSADAFLSASVFDATTAANSYGFVRYLLTSPPRFQALVAALAEGGDFSSSVESIYRAKPRTLVELWLRRKAAGKG